MAFANTKNLVTLVESADASGVVCLRVFEDEVMRTQAHAREWLRTVFMHTSFLVLRLELVKKAIGEIDLEIIPGDEVTGLKFNLVKLLQLPGLAPAAELAAFRDMLLVMRTFFEAHPQKRVDIQLCNDRDNHRKVVGSLACRVPSGLADCKCLVDAAETERLTNFIKADPALTRWLDNVALTLQKIGPWSNTVIQEDDLFGLCEGPYFRHRQSLPPEPAPDPEPRTVILLDL